MNLFGKRVSGEMERFNRPREIDLGRSRKIGFGNFTLTKTHSTSQ